MSLKDRITNAKNNSEYKTDEKDFSEFSISALKILDLIRTVETPEKLGLIVKEIAKFLENFATENISVTVSGDLDCGKKALLGCLLSGVIEEKTDALSGLTPENENMLPEEEKPEEQLSETDALFEEVTKMNDVPELQNQEIISQEELPVQEETQPVQEETQPVQEKAEAEPAMVKKRKTLRQKLKGL